ncbi:MAG TPA: hypothetical protein VJO52_11505 [Gemmatimonadaceae bacterium]|nr:hypothetical protein [Gemmatimonadaceae bacterium]
MSDLSLWEADHPGVSPEWWNARKHHFPIRAYTAYAHFHDRLWVYRNRQTEEHLHDVKVAVQSLIAAINQITDINLKIVRVKVGVASRYPNLILALNNFLDILSPHVTPDAYRDV